MELVEGPTLGERLLSGPMRIEEALPIAKEVAEALEYAHERGIIHRDLKPANVKVPPDGGVKLLEKNGNPEGVALDSRAVTTGDAGVRHRGAGERLATKVTCPWASILAILEISSSLADFRSSRPRELPAIQYCERK